MKKGFTLVELSIVLVIIGLLIGGILVAQSMIGTARVQAFVRQMQQYDVVTNHMTKYNSWPGDDLLYVNHAGYSQAVPNDKLISDDDGSQNTYNNYAENSIYFPELRVLDNLKVENCPLIDNTAFVPTVSGSNCNTPLGSLGKNNDILVFANQVGSTAYHGNYYFFTDCSAMVNAGFGNDPAGGCISPFTGAEALAYDIKIDDGIANTGRVMGFYNYPFSVMSFSPSPTAAYNVSASGLTYGTKNRPKYTTLAFNYTNLIVISYYLQL